MRLRSPDRVGRRPFRVAFPSIAVALIALMLQVLVLVAAPDRSLLDPAVRPGTFLDYAAQPYLAIPALEARFVRQLLGAGFGGDDKRSAAPPRSGPRPSPSRSATPTTSPRPIIPGAAQITTSMRVDKRSASPGQRIVYTVIAHNPGESSYAGTFLIETHTPAGTFACNTLTASCSTPGDYDGSSTNRSDNHVNPSQQTRATTVPPGQDRILYTLTVQVATGVPAGTVLHNHAHVSVVGAGKGYVTSLAPDVVVS